MDVQFKIYLDRLKGGDEQPIKLVLSPEFLEIHEKDFLEFPDQVTIHGKAYLADNHLILLLSAKTTAYMPCTVCNKMTPIVLELNNFYHTKPLEEIVGSLFDFRLPLRDALLLDLPSFVECNQGHCPERINLSPYLAEKKDQNYYPFSKLD